MQQVAFEGAKQNECLQDDNEDELNNNLDNSEVLY